VKTGRESGKPVRPGKPELLAPAGTAEAFFAAVEAGADAVYVGAPGFNARALARRFSWEEIAAMTDYAHRRGVRLYCAANSLVREDETAPAREMLHMIAGLGVDAVIVQDMGLARLARQEFPDLRLHASTLTCAANSIRVGFLARQGFARVVLPRELSLEEIELIAAATGSRVELEVFVHGAMCYSYSGLCLFSSYQGGRSGLRGRCVQPCRRRFSWRSGGGGYLFSMKDLDASSLIHRLAAAGVGSFKIEGRMRSATYVETVVRAYRMILDAPAGDKKTLREAAGLLASAMGRPGNSGYLLGERGAGGLINWRSSGNTGIPLGRTMNSGRNVRLRLKTGIAAGDRLRLHREKSGERTSFTLRSLRCGGRETAEAPGGSEVVLTLPVAAAAGDSLYLVDRRGRGSGKKLAAGRFARKVEKVARAFSSGRTETRSRGRARRSPAGKNGLPLWVRLSRPDFLKEPLPKQVSKVVLPLPVSGRGPRLPRFGRGVDVVWSLPVVMDEERSMRAAEAVRMMLDKGQRHFMIAHPGQSAMFAGSGAVLYGDYTLNILNSQAFAAMRDSGVQMCLAAVETDSENLAQLVRATGPAVGMVVYARVPLFTSRAVDGHLRYGRTFLSPKKESFELRRFEGMTVALPEEPFSLLDRTRELADMGVGFGLVDLRFHRSRRNILAALISGRGVLRRRSRFNFEATLV